MKFSEVKIGEVFTMQNTGLRGEIHDVHCLKTAEDSYFVVEYNRLVKCVEQHVENTSMHVLFKNLYNVLEYASIVSTTCET